MLTCIKGIGEKTKNKFLELGIFTPKDLLFTLPQKYIDLSKTASLMDAQNGDYCKVDVFIEKINKPFRKGKLQVLKAFGTNEEIKVAIIWFNQNFYYKVLKENEIYTFYGKVNKNSQSDYSLINPLFELKKTEESRFEGIQPVYRTKGLFSQKVYWNYIKNALQMKEKFKSVIDDKTEKKFNLMPFYEALKEAHVPSSILLTEKAKDRLLMEIIVKRIAAFKIEKQQKSDREAKREYKKIDEIEKFINNLNFELTSSQKKTTEKIINKILNNENINAMLCGDVGSGKTIVAFIICFFIIKNGHQAAFMAPTEILAYQHYEKAKQLFSEYDINVQILTSACNKEERKNISDNLQKGNIDLIIGTHSLLNNEICFSSVSLCILDEQHRFGVAQRTRLVNKGKDCHILTLSATPIPRSLQLIAYGEIDTFMIEKRYKNNVKTFIVNENKKQQMFRFIAKECKSGKQAFIVAPRIEDIEGCELNSVNEIYKKLSETFFKEQNIDFIHGKLKETEKSGIINKFKKGKLSAIIATSIIEVGIDIPNASLMLIMNADRFGQATLHQLRGRIGRDGKEAMCFLYTEKNDIERLKILEKCNDGLEIAEKDYALRGSGDIFGTMQTGQSIMNNISLSDLNKAKDIADSIELSYVKNNLKGEIMRNKLYEVSMT